MVLYIDYKTFCAVIGLGPPAPTPASECRRAICTLFLYSTYRDRKTKSMRGRAISHGKEDGGGGGPKLYDSTATLVIIIQFSLYELPP